MLRNERFVKKGLRIAARAILMGSVCLSLSACDEELWRKYFAWFQEQQQTGNTEAAKSKSILDFQHTPIAQAVTPAPQPSALSATPTDSCTALNETAPRGLACLHCLHPHAAEQAQTLVDIMLRSCIRDVATNYLVDGTFDFDASRLAAHIRALSANGRRLHLTLYLANGPTQRKYKTTTIDAFGTKMSPESFRRAIMKDVNLQYEYQEILVRVLPAIRLTEELGGEVTLVPMLEDNLNRDAFDAMLNLIEETLPADVQVRLARNACAGCYSGNDSSVPQGVFREVHSASSTRGIHDGMVTNDGIEFSMGNYQAGKVSLAELAALRDKTALSDSRFILWSGRNQGLSYRAGQPVYKHPNNRTYAMPTPDEQEALARFLAE